MKTEEIIGMSIFGLLVVAGLITAIWQGAKHRQQVAQYAARHGWKVNDGRDERLESLLEEAAPQESWRTNHVMLAGQSPQQVYLFGFQSTSKRGRRSTWNGEGCFAEHRAGRPVQPVEISTRVPLIEKMADERVEVGSDEFRKEFTVISGDEGAAQAAVNLEIQRIMLEHAAGLSWNIRVVIFARGVMVASSWAKSDEEWDYLVAMGRKLQAAVR